MDVYTWLAVSALVNALLLIAAIVGWGRWSIVNDACIGAENSLETLDRRLDKWRKSSDEWKGKYQLAYDGHVQYERKKEAELAKLKDELEECKLARLQAETMCNTLEEQAIRFAKSNADLGEVILKQRDRINELMQKLQSVRNISTIGLLCIQQPCEQPDDDEDTSDSVSPE